MIGVDQTDKADPVMMKPASSNAWITRAPEHKLQTTVIAPASSTALPLNEPDRHFAIAAFDTMYGPATMNTSMAIKTPEKFRRARRKRRPESAIMLIAVPESAANVNPQATAKIGIVH
jgi:hypothetical protein